MMLAMYSRRGQPGLIGFNNSACSHVSSAGDHGPLAAIKPTRLGLHTAWAGCVPLDALVALGMVYGQCLHRGASRRVACSGPSWCYRW